jgi:hypothetical protein
VIGVASRGTEDCGGPIYSAVTAWATWLRDVGSDAAELGRYRAPRWVETGETGAADAMTAEGEAGAITSSSDRVPLAESDGGSVRCERAEDCGPAESCYRVDDDRPGVCAPVCSSDNECPSGQACNALGVCLMPAEQGEPRLSGCAITPTARRIRTEYIWALLAGLWMLRARRGGRFKDGLDVRRTRT